MRTPLCTRRPTDRRARPRFGASARVDVVERARASASVGERQQQRSRAFDTAATATRRDTRANERRSCRGSRASFVTRTLLVIAKFRHRQRACSRRFAARNARRRVVALA